MVELRTTLSAEDLESTSSSSSENSNLKRKASSAEAFPASSSAIIEISASNIMQPEWLHLSHIIIPRLLHQLKLLWGDADDGVRLAAIQAVALIEIPIRLDRHTLLTQLLVSFSCLFLCLDIHSCDSTISLDFSHCYLTSLRD
jgi:hypothetical protein